MDLGLTIFATDRQHGTSSSWPARPRPAGFTSLWIARAHPHPHQPHDPGARPARPARRGVQAVARPLRRPGRGGRRHRAARGSAPASSSRPSATPSSPPRRWRRSTTCPAAGSSLGIGFGWNEDELADHGVAMRGTGATSSRERIKAMQALWADDVASYDGEHAHVSAVVGLAQAGPDRRHRTGRARRARPPRRGAGPEAVRPHRRVRRRLDPDRRRRRREGPPRPARPRLEDAGRDPSRPARHPVRDAPRPRQARPLRRARHHRDASCASPPPAATRSSPPSTATRPFVAS